MNREQEEAIGREVDDRSKTLIEEFYRHFDKVRESRPETDQRVAFESWSLQKLAGLQLLVEKLYGGAGFLTPGAAPSGGTPVVVCEFLFNCGGEDAHAGSLCLPHAPRRGEIVWLRQSPAGEGAAATFKAHFVEQVCYGLPGEAANTAPPAADGSGAGLVFRCAVYVNPLDDEGRVVRFANTSIPGVAYLGKVFKQVGGAQ